MKKNSAFSRGMTIADIVALCPPAEAVMKEYGLHCFHCSANSYETLEEGCRGHGMEEEEIESLVSDLCDAADEMPERPQTITVTTAAANAIKELSAEQEEKGLVVTVDGHGGFCLEFQGKAAKDEKTFFAEEVPDVKVFAAPLTLKRIGGAVIDCRDGRLKLDLPEDVMQCSCGGSCDCGKH